MVDFYTVGYTKNDSGVLAPIEVLVSGITDAPGTVYRTLTVTQISGVEEASVERKFTWTLDAYPMTITDSGANGGSGSVLLYTFPAGLVQLFGTRVKLTITGGAGIAATAAFVCGVGNTAAATTDATLSTTEVTFLPSTATTLSSSTLAFTASSTAISAFVDGRTTLVPVYLNFACPNAGISANAVLTVTGTVRMNALVI